jgi:alginate O-acetyltransferase complex protein AlgI
MVFASLTFLFLFLPAVLLLYFVTPKKWRNITLLAANLLFLRVGRATLSAGDFVLHVLQFLLWQAALQIPRECPLEKSIRGGGSRGQSWTARCF